DIFVHRCTHACSSCRPSVIYCVVCASFVHLSRRCYVKILEARSLLKIFFAVTHAASISKISFLCSSPRLRVAGKRPYSYIHAVVFMFPHWLYMFCITHPAAHLRNY